MTPIEVGQKLYRVRDWNTRAFRVEHVTIEKITPMGVWFTARAGLAFDCRTRMDLEMAHREARTPAEAIERFVLACQKEYDTAGERYHLARAWAATNPQPVESR